MARGRPFELGNKMGRGRPKGSRNKITEEARQILQTHSASLVRKGISLALQGDTGYHGDRMRSERPAREDH